METADLPEPSRYPQYLTELYKYNNGCSLVRFGGFDGKQGTMEELFRGGFGDMMEKIYCLAVPGHVGLFKKYQVLMPTGELYPNDFYARNA